MYTEAERQLLIGYLEGQIAELRATPVPEVEQAPAPAPAAEPDEDRTTHAGFGFSKRNEAGFYNYLRANDLLGPAISPTEFKGCDAITRACAEARWPLSWVADALATAYLETAHQMVPVEEAYWLSPAARTKYFTRMYDIQGARPAKARELGNTSPGDGAKYPGRGYPQLTGKTNYLKAGTALGVDLVNHPERALEPDIAAQIMVRGMSEGWFTGKKLADYLPASGPGTRPQFRASRRIVNGTDRADDLADYALVFQPALQAGNWAF